MMSMAGQTPTPARDPDPTATSSSPATPDSLMKILGGLAAGVRNGLDGVRSESRAQARRQESPGTPRGFLLFGPHHGWSGWGCPSLRKPDTLAPGAERRATPRAKRAG